MQRRQYFNRDLKDLGYCRRDDWRGVSARHGTHLGLLAGLAIVASLVGYTVYAMVDQGADIPSLANQHLPVQLESQPEVARQLALLTELQADTPDTMDAPIVTAGPATADAELALVDSGTSFRPLLEASPDAWQTHTIDRGDTFYRLFKAHGIDTADATLLARSADSEQLVKLRPGNRVHIRKANGRCEEIIYEADRRGWLHALRDGDTFRITRQALPVERSIRTAAGTVTDSLYNAAKDAGLNSQHIMELTEIFGWDVDFSLNVQPGDSFRLIYEELLVDGKNAVNGDILAAEFVNEGQSHRAYAFRDDTGRLRYYSPDGRSMHKSFLRSPVKFSRISSGFSRARYHPVLKRWRAHKGIDYAAPTGTAIRATGTGKVTAIGREGGYGKVIKLSHGSSYTTVYAHLSKFARGLRRGSTVEQGQVIGYVGATGLASGPHLHYEFKVNGAHVNPLKFKQPAAEPLPDDLRPAFLRTAQAMQERLDQITTLTVASRKDADEGGS